MLLRLAEPIERDVGHSEKPSAQATCATLVLQLKSVVAHRTNHEATIHNDRQLSRDRFFSLDLKSPSTKYRHRFITKPRRTRTS
jgi:hypothetical protein